MAASTRLPVVVVLGATGTGKSKLSLELARAFRGEIISADSMQIYKGLDVITNKVTAEEQAQCPHHMLDYLSPLHSTNTVVKFRNSALPIINRLLDKSKLPIIVGGTNYYIEALLWNFLIDYPSSTVGDRPASHNFHSSTEQGPSDPAVETGIPVGKLDSQLADGIEPAGDVRVSCAVNETDIAQEADACLSGSDSDTDGSDEEKGKNGDDVSRKHLDDEETSELYKHLMEIDPVTAQKLHPNTRRKIIRAIEVYERHGVRMSEIYEKQHAGISDEAVSGRLRFPRTCIFWLRCDREVLNKRLDKRVDSMIEQGLVPELTTFHQQYNLERLQDGSPPDYTRGIFQSIGFKEFHDYLMLANEERKTDKGKQLLQKGIEDLKMVTRRYAKKQERWIQSRFLRRPGADVPDVYGLEASDVIQWETTVTIPATEILTAVIKGDTPSIQHIPHQGDRSTTTEYNVCDVCDGRVFTIQEQWLIHLNSDKHKKRLSGLRRRKQHELQKLSHTLATLAAGGSTSPKPTQTQEQSLEKEEQSPETGDQSLDY